VWTKDFKSSPVVWTSVDQGFQKFSDEEDDVEEDDVEMTWEGSGKVSRVDEDPFEKEM
jgi:hypothetical protein